MAKQPYHFYLKANSVSPGIGKSVAEGSLMGPPHLIACQIYEAGEVIAKRLKKKLILMRLRWRNGKFVISTDGEKEFEEVLNDPEGYFVLVDIRLSTIAPETTGETSCFSVSQPEALNHLFCWWLEDLIGIPHLGEYQFPKGK